MKNGLLHFLTKDEDVSSASVHIRVGKVAGVIGIVANVFLCSMKIIVGFLSSSLSIVADGVNNLSDAASSVVTLLGFRLAQKPADEEHPYGHARYEYIAGLFVSLLIIVIGLSLVKSSIGKIINPESTKLTWVVFLVLVVSILVKILLSCVYGKFASLISSTTLKATSVDSRNDVVATLAVMLGCVLEYFFGFPLDGYIGLAVAVFILISGFGIAKETLSPLLGRKADPEIVKKLGDEISSNDKILGYHDLLIHDYGPGQCFASVHVEMSADENVMLCHQIIDMLERKVLKEMNIHLVIHYDPVVTDDEELKKVQQEIARIVKNIDSSYSIHDLRIIKSCDDSTIFFDVVIPFGIKCDEKKLECDIESQLSHDGYCYHVNVSIDRQD